FIKFFPILIPLISQNFFAGLLFAVCILMRIFLKLINGLQVEHDGYQNEKKDLHRAQSKSMPKNT
ncbi:MAG TPA: hypothetical protein VLR91_09560, partial [Thermodesulfobacteriota bacterium]|nr:hypothetical protein [Thermodesulfobacteriota bacterium]